MKKILYSIFAFGLLALTVAPALAKPNKVDVCHAEGNGGYHMINVSERALDAHLGHGDALPGEAVPGMEDSVFSDTCEVAETEPELTTETFDNWPSVADEDFGELFWQAEGRYGSNTAVGDWELGVGNNTQVVGEFDSVQHVWGESPVMQEFTVDYDADTGTATFTTGGDTTDYVVGMDAAGNLYLVARASSGVGDYVELTNLTLNGSAIGTDVMATDGGVEALKVTGADFTEDFTVTGTVEMVYTTTSGSAPAFQVQVSG